MPTPQEENSAGGLKILAVVLALVAAGLAYGWYQGNGRAANESAAATKDKEALTNQVLELRTKLALETSTATMNRTNLGHALDLRTGALLNASNRLIQVHLLFSNAQHEAQAAQTLVQSKSVALALLEAQRDDLSRRLAVIPPLEKELVEARRRGDAFRMEVAALKEKAGQLEFARAEAERKIEDPVFLRMQTRKVADENALREQYASTGRIRRHDTRARIELLPDGTVRLGREGNMK